jgi:hypothetical protein
MTNTLAIWLGVLLVGLVLADSFFLHLGLVTMTARKLVVLIEYLAFWR